ncbi:transcription initiation factor IID, TAF10 subunit [Mytilinidion resinicola]|uniref:Transcription initiation factor TFIID subunit 10 n=1 Tax=Mytilinidion resinicola TaxID=574789 RepID=A0A6A6YYZ7_9PEZI|nr:transcription initiation factor IID, TAF10 subunit [Mytilinidion resinicola]KAF2813224.1 transcription initiation factor IID, TAF10 subunit [Mytilinidion resinicola]
MADQTASQPAGTDPNAEVTDDIDRSIEAELRPNDTQADPMNLDGANDMEPSTSNGTGVGAGALEARISAKKDATLREFLGKMDDYAPIIPDAVTNYYLTLAGLPPPPQTSPHLARLLALATQKFIADIAADAYQFSRIRASNTTSNNPMGGLAGAVGSGAGPQGAAAASGAAGGKEGGPAGKGLNLGVQRPGYGGGGQGGSQGRTVLSMEDLGMAVGEYGVNIKRGEFYR